MSAGTGYRDPDKVRGRQQPVNFRPLDMENGFVLLTDDPSIGRITHMQRDRVQSFKETVVYRTTHVIVNWAGFTDIGRQDRIEVRVVLRSTGTSNPVIAHYLSAPWSGTIGSFDRMVIPFTGIAPDGFPAGTVVRGTVKTISNLPDPGGWVIDSVAICGGPPPITTATAIP